MKKLLNYIEKVGNVIENLKKVSKNKNLTKAEKEKKKGKYIPKGKKPDATNLIIVKNDDHLQFNKVDKIDERSMVQIQEGIGEYYLGVKALANKEYKTAQKHLKNTEKRLKRGVSLFFGWSMGVVSVTIDITCLRITFS